MKILVNGYLGHMGREVAALAANGYRGAELVCGVDQAADLSGAVPCYAGFDGVSETVECVVDFSHHSCTDALLRYCCAKGLPLVLATTGQTDDERAAIAEAAKQIPLFFAANYSLGVALLIELAKKTAAAMPDAEIEIIEKHHDRKLDAPSGTALAIARAIQSIRPECELNPGRSGMAKRTPTEIGIHAIRMGNIVGEHEVIVGTPNQTISLKHEAHSRALFAEGALAAAAWLVSKGPGLYDMSDMLAF